VVRRDAAINETEDLDVKVCEEAIKRVSTHACCGYQAFARGRRGSQE
jgi:hypothetical protein